jgi:hypothetical protein
MQRSLTNKFWPISILLIALCLTGVGRLRSQEKKTQTKLDETQYPVVDEYTLKVQNKTEKVKSESKAKRFRMAIAAVPNPNMTVAASIYHWPGDFSPLPVSESTVVLVGEVTEAEANLSEDRTAVYSDFKIKPIAILKSQANLSTDLVVTVTRYGGRVRFQDGNSLLVFKAGLGMPRVGRRYVLFLKNTDDDADILTAYELRGGKVFALDSGSPNFSVYDNVDEANFLQVLQQKIESLSKLTLN